MVVSLAGFSPFNPGWWAHFTLCLVWGVLFFSLGVAGGLAIAGTEEEWPLPREPRIFRYSKYLKEEYQEPYFPLPPLAPDYLRS
jgi:hypothetical protein